MCFFPGNAQFALTDSSPQKNIACARLSVSADERKQRASSQKASKRTMAERSREGIEPVNISTNTSLHLLPSPLPEKKTFLLSKWQILKYQYVPCRKVSLARYVFSSSLRARSQGRSKDESSTRTSLKKWIYFLSRLFLPTYFVKSRLTLLKSNSKGPYPSSEREIKFPPYLFTFSIKCKLGIFTL